MVVVVVVVVGVLVLIVVVFVFVVVVVVVLLRRCWTTRRPGVGHCGPKRKKASVIRLFGKLFSWRIQKPTSWPFRNTL